ncbi:hypothetical protein ARALYDRAFT_905956 [Arabidopsis lyrata subsp. lyrata]|uniref:Short-chain dehydrogenase/reductase family protein n=1 Tax=Arabidopsis lyrata subsp. lyrata TaxID=81972 RepID=D7LNC2_ARALL|nr:hypothetical protein ARALYDRAFT_905956 [Arabidopsis lyrata subsp. lyrata]
MDKLHNILNLLLPPLTISFLVFFYPFYLLIKLVSCLYKNIRFENVAGKVVLITGASSGIGEDINFWGSTYITYFAIPHLRKSKGKIVVITSATAIIPLPSASVYSASKAALLKFFETLRVEISPCIKITIAIPEFISTDMTTQFKEMYGSDFILSESVSKCAKAIFRGIGRGETYIVEPSWIKWIFLIQNVCPEIVDYVLNYIFVRYGKPYFKRD